MSTPINLGLIGAGRIGRVHAENIQRRMKDARVILVADVNEDAARRCADDFGVKYAVQDHHLILGSPAIDAVVICSATHTHAQIICEAAAAGKHIFCEKPIDFNLTAIDEALAAVAKAGVKLQIGFNRRFDANFARVRQALSSGEIGQPHLMHIISRDPGPPPLDYIKVSGGIFLDMTIHDFDMARFLMGCEVEEIFTAAAVLVDRQIGAAGDLDTALITLKFENGALGVIDNSRRAVYGYDQRVEVLGSDGGISTANLYPNCATISTAEGVRRDLPLHFFMDRYIDSYVNEMAAFVDAVRNDTPVPVGGIDGRVPVVMGLAARRSYDENRPVKLAEIAA
ncbi:MAG: inositol 2-dehydrogenase [Caldilineaceae bacterium]|nr:inositol 2-dehydrogenase [Caldilineaceae bacterium]